MGNFSSKDGHSPTGPNLDMFHTPPTSPVTADLPTVPKVTPDQPIASALTPGRKKPLPRSGSTPTSTSPPDWKPPTPVTPDSLAIGPAPCHLQDKPASVRVTEGRVAVGRNGSLSSSTSRAAPSQGKSVAASPTESPSPLGSPPSVGSPPDQSWGKSGHGLSRCPLQGPGADQGEMGRLVEESRTTLGLDDRQDMTVADVLRCLLSEVHSLRETIQAEQGERREWRQFQSDLQVAVTVADRLRAEAEEELTALRGAQLDTERELAAARQRQRETDAQLLTLRGELRESRQRTDGLAQTRGLIEAQAPNPAWAREKKANEGMAAPDPKVGGERGRGRGICKVGGGGGGGGGGEEGTEKASLNEGIKSVAAEETRTDAKGVAKRYLRNVTNEEKSGEEGRATNETRRIITTERSRSLSRLPVFSDSPAAQNGTSQSNTVSTPGSTNKNLSQPKGRRGLEPQDTWSSTHTGKQEEALNKYNTTLTDLPPNRSQDGFNLLLRRHGGSKRNSLLRWCQSRTQGYKNIDITNFSSSWADGLAFCAVYHTYLPSHIPYCTLSPESKKENLNLAFKTGENVGITQSLTVEEMLRPGGPDWQRVLGYVENMYRHFEM